MAFQNPPAEGEEQIWFVGDLAREVRVVRVSEDEWHEMPTQGNQSLVTRRFIKNGELFNVDQKIGYIGNLHTWAELQQWPLA